MMASTIFLLEEQIKQLFDSGEKKIMKGFAVSMDNDTVIHAFTESSNVFSTGNKYDVWFIISENNDEFENIDTQEFQGDCLIIQFALKNNILNAQAKFLSIDKTFKGDYIIKYIPTKSDLYSRSKGILEVSLLAKKTVGIVGLGSGGSPIAIELAKAGVGSFVLIDFDRIELSNVARHVCGINDLGRLKTFAVKDLILQKNPYAKIETLEIDVNEQPNECIEALKNVDIIVCASDNDKSRFFLNDIALKYNIIAIFGRAITRAIGGDVLRVRPHKGPCYNCLYSQNLRNTEEEISQKDRQAKKYLPDYTSENDLNSVVQVGLSSDIAPITNFMVKLILVELSKGTLSGISTLEEDLIADYYIWANRREYVYDNWHKMEYIFNKPTILRWYGAKVDMDPECLACGI